MRAKVIVILLALLLALPLAPAGLGQDDVPTIALLRFGPHVSYDLVDQGLLSAMMTAGLINAAEHRVLTAGGRLEGELVNVIWNDANYEFTNASIIIEQAIDAGADVLITYSTPVTQVARHITADMDDPPALLFASVFNPFAAGIAQATCLKPAHVSGVEVATPYEDIVPLLLRQDPDIQVIGILYSTAEASGPEGARRIAEVAASLNLAVQEAGVAQVSDLALAAEGLVEGGVEALIIPADMLTVSAMPIIMKVATENQVPVFHSNAFAHHDGATVSAGATLPALQGNLIAGMLIGHLNGSLDIGRTGVAIISELTVNLNLDSAKAGGIEVSQRLREMATVIIEDGVQHNKAILRVFKELGLDDETIGMIMEAASDMTAARAQVLQMPPHIQDVVSKAFGSGPRVADTDALLASLQCTDEMIAEQQAALEADS